MTPDEHIRLCKLCADGESCMNSGSLRKIFTSFASFAVRVPVEDLDGAKFSKLCRDAKLLGKRFSTIDVDIVFAKVKVSCRMLSPSALAAGCSARKLHMAKRLRPPCSSVHAAYMHECLVHLALLRHSATQMLASVCRNMLPVVCPKPRASTLSRLPVAFASVNHDGRFNHQHHKQCTHFFVLAGERTA